MKYTVDTDSGHVIILRGVSYLEYNAEERTLYTRHVGRIFTTHGVVKIVSDEDMTPWMNQIEIVPPISGAPAAVDSGDVKLHEKTGGSFMQTFMRKESEVPSEIAEVTFCDLSKLPHCPQGASRYLQMAGRAERPKAKMAKPVRRPRKVSADSESLKEYSRSGRPVMKNIVIHDYASGVVPADIPLGHMA